MHNIPAKQARLEFTHIVAEDKRDIEAAKEAEYHIRKHGTVSWGEIEKRLGINTESSDND